MQSVLGVSAAAAKLALNRLSKQKMIASPARGFYVIVPPEYRSLGRIPADQFIPALMKRLAEVSVQNFNTPRGTLLVSSPEATALDLVGYAHHAGGLNQVATVLSEFAERIDPEKLAAAARTAPVAWAQRLGYLLEHHGSAAKTPALKEYVREHAKQSTALLPEAQRARSRRNKGWKLYINA